jgi:hypothetical protein
MAAFFALAFSFAAAACSFSTRFASFAASFAALGREVFADFFFQKQKTIDLLLYTT